MAEILIIIEEVLIELFKGKDAALRKYQLVRHTFYEITLWLKYGYPLNLVDSKAKAYFSKRFLDGIRVDHASSEQIRKGYERLEHALKDGCHGRCYRLVEELNEGLSQLGLKPVQDIDKFLDWLTFDGQALRGNDGELIEEKPYGFPVMVFHDKENLNEFWAELLLLIKQNRMCSMQYVYSLVTSKRKHAVSLHAK